MQANIIKDVIDKIISINRDLDEEALVNLLIASGWDKADIEIGKSLFNANRPERVIHNKVIDTLPVVIDETYDDIYPVIIDESLSVVPTAYTSYSGALDNVLDNKSTLPKRAALTDKEKNIWLNIAVLALLLLTLGYYLFSFAH